MNMTPANIGMGQSAPCPSLEQMMGITDLSDPCQVAIATGQPVSQVGTAPPSNTSSLLLIAGAALVVVMIAKR